MEGPHTDDVANIGFDLIGNELVEFLLLCEWVPSASGTRWTRLTAPTEMSMMVPLDVELGADEADVALEAPVVVVV